MPYNAIRLKREIGKKIWIERKRDPSTLLLDTPSFRRGGASNGG